MWAEGGRCVFYLAGAAPCITTTSAVYACARADVSGWGERRGDWRRCMARDLLLENIAYQLRTRTPQCSSDSGRIPTDDECIPPDMQRSTSEAHEYAAVQSATATMPAISSRSTVPFNRRRADYRPIL
uniref:Uncharacterized protein n=1 Tax=Plectus sambesii TaxID=2011161 RepID=A0A914VTV0_9BILA